jgi:hypothetical protein
LKLKDVAERLDLPPRSNGEIEITRVAAIEDAVAGDRRSSPIPNTRELRTTGGVSVILSESRGCAVRVLRVQHPY